MFCNKCGKKLIPGARFCLECGSALDENMIKALEEEKQTEEAPVEEKQAEPEAPVEEKVAEPETPAVEELEELEAPKEQPQVPEKEENAEPVADVAILEEKCAEDTNEASEVKESQFEAASVAVLAELQALNNKMDVIVDLLKQHDTRLLASEEQIADVKDTIKNMKIVFGD